MATTNMPKEIADQVGKVTETPVMIINNTVYAQWQFEDFCERGWFPKSIIKRGWKPTHLERVTWTAHVTHFGVPTPEYALYPSQPEIVEIKAA